MASTNKAITNIVMVVDESQRNGWVKGRVVEVLKAKDGQVRSAVVRTSQGIIKRPAVKLALLEVNGKQGVANEVPGASELHGRGDVVGTPALPPTTVNVSPEGSLNCQSDVRTNNDRVRQKEKHHVEHN